MTTATSQQNGNDTPEEKPLHKRLLQFFLAFGLTLTFVYGVLPAVTASVPILSKMHSYLSINGIDPSRYYYTDVEQVAEGEHYIENAIR